MCVCVYTYMCITESFLWIPEVSHTTTQHYKSSLLQPKQTKCLQNQYFFTSSRWSLTRSSPSLLEYYEHLLSHSPWLYFYPSFLQDKLRLGGFSVEKQKTLQGWCISFGLKGGVFGPATGPRHVASSGLPDSRSSRCRLCGHVAPSQAGPRARWARHMPSLSRCGTAQSPRQILNAAWKKVRPGPLWLTGRPPVFVHKLLWEWGEWGWAGRCGVRFCPVSSVAVLFTLDFWISHGLCVFLWLGHTGMWGPSSPSRDGTGTPAMDAQRLNPGLPGKSHFAWTLMFTKYCIKIVFILTTESFRVPLKFPPESSIALTPNAPARGCCYCCCSLTQLCLTLCDPAGCSTTGFPVLHHLLELTQTYVRWIRDAFQPSHPLSSPSPPDFNLSQHKCLFQWVSSSHQVARVLELQLQHQSFQWIFRTDFI